MTKEKKCPVTDALESFEKSKQTLEKFLKKEAANVEKTFNALNKKIKKLTEAKKKALTQKKLRAAKVKDKATAAAKAQLNKAQATYKRLTDELTALKSEIDSAKSGHMRMKQLLKHRAAEEKLLKKYRLAQEKLAAKKAKAKPKKRKAIKKSGNKTA